MRSFIKGHSATAALLAAAAFSVVGCSTHGDSQTEPGRVVSGEETLPAGRYENITLKQGARLHVDGDELVVEGNLIVESDAALDGLDENKLVIVVTGDLDMDGEITSRGHLALVSDEDLIPSDEDLDEEEAESAFDVTPFAGPVAPAVWNVRGPLNAGKRGGKGGTVKMHVNGNLNIQPGPGLPSLTLNVPDGDDGENQSGCDVKGGKGGRGGKLNVRVRGGTLHLQDVTFSGGNGGWGGDAEGTNCPDGSLNVGGEGGKSGTFRVVAQLASSFDVEGTVRFDGWAAGNGGDAIISGEDGEPGATVSAEGGDGQDVDGYKLTVTGGINYVNNPSLVFEIGHGGEGGYAQASGGDGLEGVCQPSGSATPSFPGGDGFTIGGEGGEVDVTVSVPAGAPIDVTDSFEGGEGGDADSYGGKGGDGVDCPQRGGDGGRGGDATATKGTGGASSEGNDGDDGADAGEGGDGGHGGNSEVEGGDAGDGGDAYADDRLGGDGGNGGSASQIGGDGGDGGCTGGFGGLPGSGQTPGLPGQDCP